MPGNENPIAKCPNTSDLEQISLGFGSPEQSAWFEKHVIDCPRCVETLIELDTRDELQDSLQLSAAEYASEDPKLDSVTDSLLQLYPNCVGSNRDHRGSVTSETSLIEQLRPWIQRSDDKDELRLNDYLIESVIGAGGMGIVLRGKDINLKRDVAIKVLRPHLAENDSARLRFLREARAMASVKDELVVPIYEVNEAKLQNRNPDAQIESRLPFLVMPLLKGTTLAELLRKRNQLTFEEIQNVGIGVSKALSVIHRSGLIHRDVKPGNIWIETTSDGIWRIKLLDLGLASEMDGVADITRSSQIVGTPSYMSPEQARGEPLDPRSDLFALGCVLYCCAVGKPPFAKRNPAASLLALVNERESTVRELVPNLGNDISEIIDKLMEKRSELRFATADDTCDAILALSLRGASSSLPSNLRFGKTTKTWIAASLGVFSLFVFGLLAFKISSSRSRSPAFANSSKAQTADIDFGHWQSPTNVANGFHSSHMPGLIKTPKELPNTLDWQIIGARTAGMISSVAWNPRHDLIATSTNLGKIRITHWPSNELRQVIVAHSASINDLKWSADGTLLVSCGDDGMVRVWSGNDRLHASLDCGDVPLTSVAVSPNGDRIVSGNTCGELYLWSPDQPNAEVIESHGAAVTDLSWHPQNQQFLSIGEDFYLRVWTLDGDSFSRIRRELPSIARCVTWSSDGSRYFTGHDDYQLRGWDPQTGSEEFRTTHSSTIMDVQCSHDGRIYTCSADSTIRISKADGELVSSNATNEQMLNCISSSPDGNRFVVGSELGSITFWNTDCAFSSAIYPVMTPVTAIDWTDNDHLVIGDQSGRVTVVDASFKIDSTTKRHDRAVYDIESSLARKICASASIDGRIQIWHDDATLPISLDGNDPIAWHESGDHLAFVKDHRVLVWERDSQKTRVVADTESPVVAVTWAGDDLIVGDNVGNVTRWKAAKRLPELSGDPVGDKIIATCVGPVLTLAWDAPNKKLWVGSAGESFIRTFDDAFNEISRIETGQLPGATKFDLGNSFHVATSARSVFMIDTDNDHVAKRWKCERGVTPIGTQSSGDRVAIGNFSGSVEIKSVRTGEDEIRILLLESGVVVVDETGYILDSTISVDSDELTVLVRDGEDIARSLSWAEFLDRYGERIQSK